MRESNRRGLVARLAGRWLARRPRQGPVIIENPPPDRLHAGLPKNLFG